MSIEMADLIAIVTASGTASGAATWAAMKVKLDWLRKDVDDLKKQVPKLWEKIWSLTHQ